MITSFACRDTGILYHSGRRPGWMPPQIRRRALRRLDVLAAATALLDLASPPSHRLERLKGDLAGRYAIRINDQWRVVFGWDGEHAFDVAIVDDH